MKAYDDDYKDDISEEEYNNLVNNVDQQQKNQKINRV